MPVSRRQCARQQCRTQISFILCQWWIGAEEANSLESYKKKVSEIIKHPGCRSERALTARRRQSGDLLSTFSQTLRASAPFFFLTDSQILVVSPFRAWLPVFFFCSRNCVDGTRSSEYLIFWSTNLASSLLFTAAGRAWRMDTDRAHTSHWETRFRRHSVKGYFSFFVCAFCSIFFFFFCSQGCSSQLGIDAVLWCFSSLRWRRGHPRYQRRARRRTPSSLFCRKRHLHPLQTAPPPPTAESPRNITSLRR